MTKCQTRRALQVCYNDILTQLSLTQITLLASWHVEPATAAFTRASTWFPWWSPTVTTPCRAAPAPSLWGCAPATVKATWNCVMQRLWAALLVSAPELSSPSSCVPSYYWVSMGKYWMFVCVYQYPPQCSVQPVQGYINIKNEWKLWSYINQIYPIPMNWLMNWQ